MRVQARAETRADAEASAAVGLVGLVGDSVLRLCRDPHDQYQTHGTRRLARQQIKGSGSGSLPHGHETLNP